MAGKLVFKLTGGKSDKDEEYEALKDEFLKYKKVRVPKGALRPASYLPRHARASRATLASSTSTPSHMLSGT